MGVIDTASDSSDQTDTTLVMINKLRGERGLEPLSRQPATANAARDQARRMATAGKMQHNMWHRCEFLQADEGHGRAPAGGREHRRGAGRRPARAFQALGRFAQPLAAMLGSGYRGLGVAEARSPKSGNRPYWAMVLFELSRKPAG